MSRERPRLLLVHAHPDDESITCGATMAYYAAGGAQVTLLTCTLGEEGEILAPEYAELAADRADQLGGLRIWELDRAMRALGVTDHRWLGGAGRYRDSGMMGTPANAHPRAFWRADSDASVFDAAVDHAVEVIREVRPHVVVTYDDFGGYGHPDHIMAHRVATAAVERAAEVGVGSAPAWSVAKVYWTAAPKSVLRREFAAVEGQADLPFGVASVDDLPFGVDDELVTTAVDATGFGERKLAALRAHRTQIAVQGHFFALSNMLGREALSIEYFRLVEGRVGDDRHAGGELAGYERDLFAGLDLAPATP